MEGGGRRMREEREGEEGGGWRRREEDEGMDGGENRDEWINRARKR